MVHIHLHLQPNDNEKIKAFVTQYSHLLITDYIETMLDAFVEESNGYERSKFIVLNGLLGNCRNRGIEKAFEIFDYQTHAIMLNIFHLVSTCQTLDEKREFVEIHKNTLLTDIAAVLMWEFIKSSQDLGLFNLAKLEGSEENWENSERLILCYREKGIWY